MKKLACLTLILINIYSCQKDVNEQVSSTGFNPLVIDLNNFEPEIIPVTATLAGVVYNELGQPMVGASVILNNFNTNVLNETTDEGGAFIFHQVPMNAAGTFVLVKKEGYFNGSTRIFPKEDSQNYANIKLLAKQPFVSFDSNSGGLFGNSEGIKIGFPPSSIIKSSGEAYEGNVNVSMRWIDPTANDLPQIMPGNLQGVNALYEEVAMASYGMMAVELNGENGEELNIGNNQEAELTFPVPSELRNNAPSEISLWYFNEEYGLWQEEGMAFFDGIQYKGKVSHFSFWNCDAPFPIVKISGIILTENGFPMSNTSVCVNFVNSNEAGACGKTDNSGYFEGKMPANKELSFSISQSGPCNYVSPSYGPFSSDTDIGIIEVDIPELVEITGTVLDCSDNPLLNGWVELKLGNHSSFYYLQDNNEFSMAMFNCDNATGLLVTAVNLDDLQESDVLTFPVNSSINIGEIQACGNGLSEYFTLTINGDSKTFNIVSQEDPGNLGGVNPESTVIRASSGSDNLLYGFIGDDAGIFDDDGIDIFTFGIQFPVLGLIAQECGGTPCGPSELIVTEYGDVGEKIKGTFNGTATFYDTIGPVDYPYSGAFELYREF